MLQDSSGGQLLLLYCLWKLEGKNFELEERRTPKEKESEKNSSQVGMISCIVFFRNKSVEIQKAQLSFSQIYVSGTKELWIIIKMT